MKVYVKTSSFESSDFNPYGRFVHYTITDHAGPFDSTHEAVEWALDAGYEGFEILEFEECKC
jgi:hypothetical protein